MRVAIIGGGIGGLTAAIALRQAGMDAVVFERAPRQHGVGAGISLWANALTCLNALNLEMPVIACGAPIAAATFRAADGTVLLHIPLQREYSLPAVVVRRDELQSVLLAALPAEAVHFDSDCVGFEQNGQGVSLRLRDGRQLHCDLLVGADGIRSTIRKLLFGAFRVRYSGFTAWRGVARFPHDMMPSAGGNEWWGSGSIFGAAPMSGDRVYWYGEARRPEGEMATVSHKADSLEHFAAWQAVVPAIIESTDLDAVLRHDGYDAASPAQWSIGRVTLLGDAAHPMRPNIGQGGCQAIEDAVFLAIAVAGATDPAQVLRRYEAERRARALRAVRLSWLMSLGEHAQDGLLRVVRDTIVRAVPESLISRSMDSLLRVPIPVTSTSH